MRENVIVQVGQCGNQIGACFWDLVLKEHASVCVDGEFDPCMSSYFRNVDVRTGDDSSGRLIRSLRARAVVIDTEEGVLSQLLGSHLGELFDSCEFVKGESGAGNNFAHGHFGYGSEYGGAILESVRRTVERCDSLQSFSLVHSTGGGTGSGLGTFIIGALGDEYSKVLRFSNSILPSADDDVITSPYNAALALHELREHADCIFPMDNQALVDICNSVQNNKKAKNASVIERGSSKKLAFDDMNSIAAHMMSNLTCGARFPGKMNVDISEVSTNLVPFPKMQFILSSLSPLYALKDTSCSTPTTKNLDRTFMGALARRNQLIKCDPAHGQFLSCALLMRGKVNISDINRYVERLSGQIDMATWNPDGFKLGHCGVAPIGYSHSLLCLSNNSSICKLFRNMERRFMSLYGRKAYLHHYTEFMEEDYMDQALETLKSAQDDYSQGLDRLDVLARASSRSTVLG